MSEQDERAVRDATKNLIDRLAEFDEDSRRRIVRTALTYFEMDEATAIANPTYAGKAAPGAPAASAQVGRDAAFADRQELSPKDFLFQKQPQTDVDRIACLAYYLTHFRDARHFKTVDVSKLNTEAAQVKFSNTAYAVVNAANAGILVPAGKGFKQLSALGERYVEALPDRAKAKEVMQAIRARRTRKANKNNKQVSA
jgi:hypothetical protein